MEMNLAKVESVDVDQTLRTIDAPLKLRSTLNFHPGLGTNVIQQLASSDLVTQAESRDPIQRMVDYLRRFRSRGSVVLAREYNPPSNIEHAVRL
jgi:hypothetical protein